MITAIKDMTRQQADMLYHLAWFIETQVPEKNLTQHTFRHIARGESANSLMLAECRSTCCALGWAAYLWPKEWEWSQEGVPFLKKGMSFGTFRDAMVFFCITYDEACVAFGTTERTPKQEAYLLRSFAAKRGYVEQEGSEQ